MWQHALAAMSCVFGLAVADNEVVLERKFQEGTSYAVETSSRTTQKLTILGTDTETASETKSVTKATVGKPDVEGNVRIQEKIESLQISMNVMGQSYQFDSANPDAKGSSPLEFARDVHKALVDRTTTTVHDKSHKVIAIESDKDLAGAIPAEAQALVKSSVDTTYLKNVANEELDQLKTDPIKPGDTWERTRTVNFGAGQIMTFKNAFTYVGTIEKDGRKLEKITYKTLGVSFTLEDSPLPLALKSSDLKPAESEGLILFDRERGLAVESTNSVRITGDLTFVLNEKELPSKLDLKMDMSTVVKP